MSKGTFEFQTIESSSNEILYKDKGSKFFGYAFPIYNENDVKNTIGLLKEKHKTAGHCRMVAITGCHKKGAQPKAGTRPHGSI